MLTPQEARNIANQNGLDKKVQEKIEEIERRIRRASEDGHTSCCAFGNLDYEKSDVELEAKKHFQKLGFKFRQTPPSFGVVQLTEDIHW